jgi:hypothetical protein
MSLFKMVVLPNKTAIRTFSPAQFGGYGIRQALTCDTGGLAQVVFIKTFGILPWMSPVGPSRREGT